MPLLQQTSTPQPPPPPLPPPSAPPFLTTLQRHHPSTATQQQQQPPAISTATTLKPTTSSSSLYTKYIFKTKKSSSLDHDIFVQHRKTTEWKQYQHHPLQNPTNHLPTPTTTIPRAASTASLASVVTSTNYQEYKMEIINQGKCLCSQYIRARLRRAGVLNRKAVQRLRTIVEPSSEIVYDVFPALNSMGEELERMHPRIYTNVSRQLSRAPFGELEDSDAAPMLLNLVAKDLFRSSITWGKIISIFAVCGGFAIDCVRQGHYDYLQFLVDGLAEIIEDDLVHWLADNGGWLGLQQHIRPQSGQITFLGWLGLFVAVSSGVYVISNFVKHLGCHLYSLLF